jgi:OmpA-OmpF porin, OOP family
MRRLAAILVTAGSLLTVSAAFTAADAQILKRATERAKEVISKKAENAVSCVLGDDACIVRAKQAGHDVVVTDQAGGPLPESEQARAVSAAGAQAARPGEGAWASYDFVPGQRVLFREDFSSDRVGNFPRRLEFLNGNAEIVTWEGGRWLRSTDWVAFAVPLPEVLPEKFTIEFQVTLPWWGMIVYGGPDGFVGEGQTNVGSKSHSYIVLNCCEVGIRGAGGAGGSVTDARNQFEFGDAGIDGHLFNVRIQADGRYLKLYLDEKRLANIPNADFNRTNKLYFEIRPSNENPVMIGNLSINAGGQDLYDALMADGRVVTQGILFDVNSDVLRPESTPTLVEIADMLKQHQGLRLGIEGHTDNTGEAAHNQSLSERRAAAVMAYLVGAGITASRLESHGFGPSRPMTTNDTPEGRQSNRRVELVRLN